MRLMEREHRVLRLKAYLRAGLTKDGAIRDKDIVHFYAEHGGLRTVYAEDLVVPGIE
jgi:hypothetical protein